MKVCSVCQRCYEDSAVSCIEENHSPLSKKTHSSGGDGGGIHPEIIAGYRLEFLLEDGPNAETYRARQIASGQYCQIKILCADLPRPDKERFLREAETAVALVHPNVAEVYEAGVLESGECFVVAAAEEGFGTAEGQTLRELLNETGAALPLLTAIQIARQTAESLHALHLQGLTHGAVNPANIILTDDNSASIAGCRLRVKIQNLDFGGLERRFVTSSRFASEAGLYKLRYFAPEQCGGAAEQPTEARTDVYSLGVVFYEMLAGAPPFDGTTAAALIEKHKNLSPPEIKINNFDLRMLISHTLMEALRKQPKMRHASAGFFARQLRHIEQLATHSPTPPPAVAATRSQQKSTVKSAAATTAATAVRITTVDDSGKLTNIEPTATAATTAETPDAISIESLAPPPPTDCEIKNESADVFADKSLDLLAAGKASVIDSETDENDSRDNCETREKPISAEGEGVTAAPVNLETPDAASLEETQPPENLSPVAAEKSAVANFAKKQSEIEQESAPLVAEEFPRSSLLAGNEDAAAENRISQVESEETATFPTKPNDIYNVPVETQPVLIGWEQPAPNDVHAETRVSEIPQQQQQLTEQFDKQGVEQNDAEDFLPEQDCLTGEDLLFAEEDCSATDLSPDSTAEADESETIARRVPMFSSGAPAAFRFPPENRSLFVGGGVAALLLVLFFVGYAFLSAGLSDRARFDEPVTDQSPAAGPAAQKPPPSNFAALPMPPTGNSETFQPTDEDYDAADLKPLPVSAEKPIAFTSAKSAAARRRTPKSKDALARNANAEKTTVSSSTGATAAATTATEKAPKTFAPSTLVIYAGGSGGKVKSKVETEKKPAAKKTSPGAEPNDIFTRPRIVKNTGN